MAENVAAGRAGAAPGAGTERRLWRTLWRPTGSFLGAPLVLNSLTIIIHSSYNSDLVRSGEMVNFDEF